jgi:hypothetical protein
VVDVFGTATAAATARHSAFAAPIRFGRGEPALGLVRGSGVIASLLFRCYPIVVNAYKTYTPAPFLSDKVTKGSCRLAGVCRESLPTQRLGACSSPSDHRPHHLSQPLAPVVHRLPADTRVDPAPDGSVGGPVVRALAPAVVRVAVPEQGQRRRRAAARGDEPPRLVALAALPPLQVRAAQQHPQAWRKAERLHAHAQARRRPRGLRRRCVPHARRPGRGLRWRPVRLVRRAAGRRPQD